MSHVEPTTAPATLAAPACQTGHRTVVIQKHLLAKNDRQAELNRHAFQSRGILALNMLSSPGSGKTKLLERTLDELGQRLRIGVIVGDLQTENDAERLEGRGAAVVAVTTRNVCHLEAEMIALACEQLPLDELDVVVIENVGNLVCPASFDLGEELRVVLLSTTEGEDKPLKYPKAFKSSHVAVLNKIDMADAAGFDRDAALRNIGEVSPQATILELSARTGQGVESWLDLLQERAAVRRTNKSAEAVRR